MGSPVVAASPRKSPSSGRRTNKPLVEKKRRARINGCLGQLKSLILSAMQTEGTQASRLEKADILELTVKYLRHVQRQQVTAAVTSEPEVMAKFSAGYTECATEVIRYMDSVQCVTPDVKSRLESHLVERLRESVPVSSSVDPSVVTCSAVSTTLAGTQQHAAMPDSSSVYTLPAGITSEEMSRHYQTALDLANMAAAVTAKDAAVAAEVAQAAVVTSGPISHGESLTCGSVAISDAPLPRVSVTVENSLACGDVLTKCTSQSKMFENHGGYPSAQRDTGRPKSISPACLGLRPDENTSSAMMRSPSSSSSSSSSSFLSVYDNSCEARRRHSSSEPAFSSSFSSAASLPPSSLLSSANLKASAEMRRESVNSDMNNNYTNYKNSRDAAASLTGSKNNSNSVSDYLSAFQQPLHIHIPDSPPQPTSPSPPFLHPQVAYPHPRGPILIPTVPTTSSSAVTASVRYTGVDDAPPTILYACDGYHHMPVQSTTSPHSTRQTVWGGTPAAVQYDHRGVSQSNRNKFFSNDTGKENTDAANNYSHYLSQAAHIHRNTAHVLGDTMVNSSHNYTARSLTHSNCAPPHPTLPATPSPPTLIREEFDNAQFIDRLSHQGYVCSNNNNSNTNDNDNNYSSIANEKIVALGSRYNNQNLLERSESSSNNYHHQRRCNNISSTEFHHRHHQQQHHQGQSYPHHHSNQSTSSSAATTATIPDVGREYLTAQTTHTTAITNNGPHGMNGPSQSQHPRVLRSRQNDTALSPPTLKKRLLFAQGSEGEGTVPVLPKRCKEGQSEHWDKRRDLQQHDIVGLSGSRRNGQVRGDGRETLLCRGGDIPLHPEMLCTVPAHTVSAEDGLWRPW